MNKLPLYEADSRLKRVQQTITEMEADACIITSSVNQYWLCGFIFDGFMFLFPEGDPILFVKRPSNIVDERAKQIRKPEQIPDMLREIGISLPKRILVEADQLSFSAATRLQAALGMPETKNISGEVRKIRSVKSEYELEQMRESARIHAYVYELIPSLYREGMTDLELQIEIERQMRLHGSVGIFRSFGENMDIFMGSMLAGDNAQTASPYDYALGGAGISPLLPLGANGTLLLPGTTLMVDMAGNYRPWMDDMTRTFAIEHTPDMAYKVHQVSIDIHNAIMKNFRAGALCSELYLLAEEIVNQNGLAPYFMGTIQQAQFIGHGVGLEINEPPVLTPRSREVLEPGIAFALEPKFVLPGIGAVGIENTYVVHESGFEKITLCEEAMIALS
ncbi:Xaa-Pro aminopeptidase [Proteiniphilum saccharofermentans]|uniref:Xaa-Pro aminopeptidase n=1 Tax=Proteiniphilum saccharofermentans TaxID=1642647 RepID=A0A1R3T5P6_9BACT|nr:Xaa-Pro peptidase family protein [Proteiniphilum saccharofermentans]SCD21399.1 Xaa-Pro aminopeptidase [Proteiniphilum saccharofermentans]